MTNSTKEERQQRPSPYQKKQEDYDRERMAIREYPHRHRRYYPIVKDRFQRMERHLSRQAVEQTLESEGEIDVSNALLQTISRRCRGPKHGAGSLREIVEWKLERRIQKHGAKKRRHGLPVTPRDEPKNP